MKNEMSIHRTQRTLAKRAFGTNAEAVAMETAIKEAVNFIFFKEFFVEQHNKICITHESDLIWLQLRKSDESIPQADVRQRIVVEFHRAH